jgi:hypothetical protein
MCSAPIGSVPALIPMDELASGIEEDISGIGDLVWLAAAEGCPDEEHAAASSATAATPTAPLKTAPGRGRPREQDVDMDRPPQVPAPAHGHRHGRLR